MNNEKLLHGLIIEHLRQKLSREYKEIKVNPSGNPDLILSNHGLVLAILEVETEESINSEKAETWKEMVASGSKLILMVPKNSRVKAMELLWQKGIADKAVIGTYEISVTMP